LIDGLVPWGRLTKCANGVREFCKRSRRLERLAEGREFAGPHLSVMGHRRRGRHAAIQIAKNQN